MDNILLEKSYFNLHKSETVEFYSETKKITLSWRQKVTQKLSVGGNEYLPIFPAINGFICGKRTPSKNLLHLS